MMLAAWTFCYPDLFNSPSRYGSIAIFRIIEVADQLFYRQRTA